MVALSIPKTKIQIRVFSPRIPIPQNRLQILSRKVLSRLGISSVELSLFIVDDACITRLNEAYLGRRRPTDVMAFSMREGAFCWLHRELLGDVVISSQRVKEQAKILGVDFREELERCLIHGILHLVGYNDQTPAQKRKMLAIQERLLKAFMKAGVSNVSVKCKAQGVKLKRKA